MEPVQKVVIAGGGTAGWIAAATLSSQLGSLIDITLVESAEIPTVGVGESTIPTHRAFHRLIGIDEQEFMRETQATFKLGIDFINWGDIGERYFHAFGKIGRSTWMGDFQHLWQHAYLSGLCGEFHDYSFEYQAAKAGKFSTKIDTSINYAYHLDANLYSSFLKKFSQLRGVERIEGTIEKVELNDTTGYIRHLLLNNGTIVSGDLFIDCTGFKGLLINKALGVNFEDWSHWLPMDRAWSVQTSAIQDIPPYTKSIAHGAGWQWRIPLQNRVGNGLVFCSEYISDDEAHQLLMRNLEEDATSESRFHEFTTGKREKIWKKNCVSIGLSSGFLEPLESTSIHLSQITAMRLVKMFPFGGMDACLQKQFNTYIDGEFNSVKDFLILHYKLTKRPERFWKQAAAMKIPDTLKHRVELYKKTSIAIKNDMDLFGVDSWNQVLLGQGLKIEGFHKMGQLVQKEHLQKAFDDLKSNIDLAVDRLPLHSHFLLDYEIISSR
ncbi:tryptophan halogenase family protein [Gilvimarinus agarilyticus]|uniref:tryptophan halogenase family protein n=1 Tax=Gilvimarinus agarilyticus TaxID=679259 RepID=UPI0005A29552|nr:tryptophan halogenase family protein [Gilvimarinus agarilyticus]